MLQRIVVSLLVACAAAVAQERVRVASVDATGLGAGQEAQRALADQLGERADVVVLQGVFDNGVAEALKREFAALKLEHALRYDKGWGGSGLLIVSRYPLEDDGFTTFEWAGKPHKPWHGDYYKTKGVGLLTVDSPLGPFWIGATAWHKHHPDEEYRWLRIHQALETADVVGNHGAIPPESARDTGRYPLLIAGALDCEPGDLPLRVVSEASGASPVRRDMGPGWLLTRAGGAWGLKLKRVQQLFDKADAPVDQPGWVAEFRKQPYPNGPPLADSAPFRATADKLLPLAKEEVAVSHEEGKRATLAGIGLFFVGGALYAIGWILGSPRKRKKKRKKRPRPSGEGAVDESTSGSGRVDPGERKVRSRPRRRGCCLFGCLSLIVAHGALWLIYQGRVFVPYEIGGLESCVSRLEPPEIIVIEGR